MELGTEQATSAVARWNYRRGLDHQNNGTLGHARAMHHAARDHSLEYAEHLVLDAVLVPMELAVKDADARERVVTRVRRTTEPEAVCRLLGR